MTLLQFTTFVCGKLNQSDATSMGLCKQFVNLRYGMIYDTRNWKDSLKNIPINLTDTTTGLLQFPASIDRIVAIRANGDHILVPVDSPQAMQLDPQVFERSGSPVAFEDYTDETSNPPKRMIRFFPIPSVTTPLLIVGKRVKDELVNDSDTPILRNVDDAIIAYANGDMLERQRQSGKAQAKFQEAAAILNVAIKLESEQAGNMPRIIPSVEPLPMGIGFESWDMYSKAG